MSEPFQDRRPQVSSHAAKRRRSSRPVPTTAVSLAIPPCPGLTFHWKFSSGLRFLVDLTYFSRPLLAQEAVQLLWSGCHDGTYGSEGNLASFTQMLARLAEYLTERDEAGRIASLRDISTTDIDGFDVWLHQERYQVVSSTPYCRLQGLVCFLRRALDAGYADASITERCQYTSKLHDRVKTTPRDAYDDFTMASLRAAARTGVDRVLERLRRGEIMTDQAGSPKSLDDSTPADIVRRLREHGMVTREEYKQLRRRFDGRETTTAQMLDLVYLSINDCVPFVILLAETTGLPIESVRELDADCIDTVEAESGFATIRYVKRRRFGTEEKFEDVVSTREKYSTGWLVRELIRITAPARRELGFGSREGSLFIGRLGLSVGSHVISSWSVRNWQKKNPIATDPNGGELDRLQLCRIRKWHKASVQYVGGGGSLDAVRDDHTTAVFVRHYGNIPSLARRHDDAIRAGIQEAHDAAMLPHVLTAVDEGDLTRQLAEAARMLDSTEDRVRGVASGAQDSWVAGCLAPHDSPFSAPGEPCGAPLYGCLDCANAVFTAAKIPNLVRLARHIAAERQRMDLCAWRQNFAFAYARIRQILDLYPREDVEAAMRETPDQERDFTLTQLTHRMRRA